LLTFKRKHRIFDIWRFTYRRGLLQLFSVTQPL